VIVSSSRLLIVSLGDFWKGGETLHELEADIREIEGLRGVRKINGSVHGASSVSKLVYFGV
jgi:hypothetical protein